MADTIYNEAAGIELTPHVAKVTRTPSLAQVVNTALNGVPYIQNLGAITYQTQVEFVIHSDMDSFLLRAWSNGDLIKVVDGLTEIRGYLLEVALSGEYADGYHSGSFTLQEEVEL